VKPQLPSLLLFCFLTRMSCLATGPKVNGAN
jgi:hypothetical protein